MFRNNYLETYKHAAKDNKEIEILFVHLSQIYATLGSVINDIEYQCGLILSSRAPVVEPRQKSGLLKKDNGSEHSRELQYDLQNENFQQMNQKLQAFENGFKGRRASEPMQTFKKTQVPKSPRVSEPIPVPIVEQSNQKPSYKPIESTQDFESLFKLDDKKQEQTHSRRSSAVSKGEGKTKSKGKPSNDYMDKLFK